MNSPASLSGAHARTYEAIFRHPLAHNLAWKDVHTLLGRLGEVAEEPNGNFKATRHGEVLVLHVPRSKEVATAEELMQLRHFLQRSEPKAGPPVGPEPHWLLVIDHHEARIFRTELKDGPLSILPHEPADFFRHVQDSLETARGKEKPDPNSFFEPVARALSEPGPVLIFGTGTGSSNEMDQFVAWAEKHHPALAVRILGTRVVDKAHLSEGQLLAKAREFYATFGQRPAA